MLWNALITRTPPNRRDLLAFLSLFIGLCYVVGGTNISILKTNSVGAAWAVCAAISYSFYVIINQETGKKIGSILFTSYAVTASFMCIMIHYNTIASDTLDTISIKGWGIITMIAIFCTALPLLLFSEGIKHIGASRASLLSMLGPVITAIAAYIVLDEILSFQQIGGIIVVLTILILIEKDKSTHTNS